MNINGVPHHYDSHGFLKQSEPEKFDYSKDYLEKQGTTQAMAYLRMAIMAEVTGIRPAHQPMVLEIGVGSGVMLRELMRVYGIASPASESQNLVCNVFGHDVGPAPDGMDGQMMSMAKIDECYWNMLFACDVIEHFHDIDHLWDFKFQFAYLSFPRPPEGFIGSPPSSTTWRHFKPNEHVYYLGQDEVTKWVEDHGYEVVYWGCPEDMIRRPPAGQAININSVIIERKREPEQA